MTNQRKRNGVIGGLFAIALGVVLLGPARSASASDKPESITASVEQTEACSSGVVCGGSCCNNRTDKCCKGSCIGANDRCQ